MFQATGTLRKQGTFNLDDMRGSVGDSSGKVYMSGTQDSTNLQQTSEYTGHQRQSLDFLGDQTSQSAAIRERNQYKSEGRCIVYSTLLDRMNNTVEKLTIPL